MPMLDVSDVLLDPDFCETFTVTRRATTVGTNGRTVTTTTTLTPVGVVTPESPDPFQLETDYEHAKNRLSIITPTELYAATSAYLPDLITWQNSTYVVKRVSIFQSFGSGFFEAEAELQSITQSVA